MRSSFRSRCLVVLGLMVLLCCGERSAQAQTQETPAPEITPAITVDEYCRLTISLMELSANEWRDRIAAAGQSRSRGDRRKLQAELETKTRGHRSQEENIFRDFGLSRRTYLDYSAKHRAEIENHLEANPEVKDAIESVQKRINRLIEEFELTVRQQGVRQ